jgi:hypothetical protein
MSFDGLPSKLAAGGGSYAALAVRASYSPKGANMLSDLTPLLDLPKGASVNKAPWRFLMGFLDNKKSGSVHNRFHHM